MGVQGISMLSTVILYEIGQIIFSFFFFWRKKCNDKKIKEFIFICLILHQTLIFFSLKNFNFWTYLSMKETWKRVSNQKRNLMRESVVKVIMTVNIKQKKHISSSNKYSCPTDKHDRTLDSPRQTGTGILLVIQNDAFH